MGVSFPKFCSNHALELTNLMHGGMYQSLKIPLFIPPAAALLVVLSWNVAQWREVSSQQVKSADLRKRLGMVQSTQPGRSGKGRVAESNRPEGDGPIDWKELSSRLADMRKASRASDLQDMQTLKNQLAAMSREEIIAALDQISAMGLADEAKRPLEDLLIGPLAAVDPEAALDRFSGRIREGSQETIGLLTDALQSWADQDPKAASSWMDRQIQAGMFDSLALDGRNEARLAFEASLLGELLETDPAAAMLRVAALPEDQRREVLEPIPFADLDDAARMAYIQMVRELVPKNENPGSLVHIVSELVPTGGYDQVDAFLDQIKATADERAVSARQAANTQLGVIAAERPLTRDDVEEMRKWLETQSPSDVDTVTGRALGEVVQDGGKMSFQEASTLVFDYQKSSGNDDVLVAFIRSFAARSNLERASSLADRIQDPVRRQKILDELN